LSFLTKIELNAFGASEPGACAAEAFEARLWRARLDAFASAKCWVSAFYPAGNARDVDRFCGPSVKDLGLSLSPSVVVSCGEVEPP
jgi:hypothetical protein